MKRLSFLAWMAGCLIGSSTALANEGAPGTELPPELRQIDPQKVDTSLRLGRAGLVMSSAGPPLLVLGTLSTVTLVVSGDTDPSDGALGISVVAMGAGLVGTLGGPVLLSSQGIRGARLSGQSQTLGWTSLGLFSGSLVALTEAYARDDAAGAIAGVGMYVGSVVTGAVQLKKTRNGLHTDRQAHALYVHPRAGGVQASWVSTF